MQHAIDVVLGLVVTLFDLVVAAIAIIERFARHALGQIGINGQPQTVILVLLVIALIIAAFQVFGRLFAVLIALVLLLILVHALIGGSSAIRA